MFNERETQFYESGLFINSTDKRFVLNKWRLPVVNSLWRPLGRHRLVLPPAPHMKINTNADLKRSYAQNIFLIIQSSGDTELI